MRPNKNARKYLAGSAFTSDTPPTPSTATATVALSADDAARRILNRWRVEAGKTPSVTLAREPEPIKVQLPVDLRKKQRRSRRQVAAIMANPKFELLRRAHAEECERYSVLAAGNQTDAEFARALGMNLTAAQEWCRALESTFLRFCEDKPSTKTPGDAVNMEDDNHVSKDLIADAHAAGQSIAGDERHPDFDDKWNTSTRRVTHKKYTPKK